MSSGKYIAGGYFKSPRTLFDSDIWKDRDKLRLFQLLIGRANHQRNKPQKISSIKVGYGQYLRSYRKLQEDLEYVENHQIIKYPLSKIKRMVDKLIVEGRIMKEDVSEELGTLFSVCNYHIYQDATSYELGSMEQTRNRRGTEVKQTRNNNNNSKKSENYKNSSSSEEEDIIFKGKLFSVTKEQLEKMRLSYPKIRKFHPEFTRADDVMRGRMDIGEEIRDPMAFLHTHLTQANGRAINKGFRRSDYPPQRTGGSHEPQLLGDILKDVAKNNSQFTNDGEKE